jgi:hypothetical protein
MSSFLAQARRATHLTQGNEGDLCHLHGEQVPTNLSTDNRHDQFVKEGREEKGDKHGT